MALSKVNFDSLNVTPAASKAIKFNSNNNGIETGDVGGSLVLISEQTASSSANISFTSGIDSTYKEYIIKFINVHAATGSAHFQFNLSADSGSNYNVTKTTTMFRAYHKEDDSATALAYSAGRDLAQGTGDQQLSSTASADNDGNISGTLHLFDPSNTTFVKHFIARTNAVTGNAESMEYYMAGYGNTTSAVNAIKFLFSSGNIDAGDICLYGIL